jgi:hypothetical protein
MEYTFSAQKPESWGEYESVRVGTFSSGKLIKCNEKYILEYDGKYKVFLNKPTSEDISKEYKNFEQWPETKQK